MKSPDDQESAVLPVLYGARYSVYTRICLSAFEMKDVPFHFAPLDVFAADGHAEARRAGHPFGKIPVLHHGSLTIYETSRSPATLMISSRARRCNPTMPPVAPA
jgi:hypothetical protein